MNKIAAAVAAHFGARPHELERHHRRPLADDVVVYLARDLKTKSGQIVRFIDAYAGNREDTVEGVLEADPVAVAIRRFMADREEWQGIATELLVHLNGVVGEKAGAAKDWPKDGTRLSSRLTRVATHLRVIGINVRRDRRRATGRRFTIRRELLDREGKIASPASPASQDNTTNGLGGDTMTFANPRPAPPRHGHRHSVTH